MALATLIHRPPTRFARSGAFDRWLDDLWGGFGLAPLAFGDSAFSPARRAAGPIRPRLDARELESEYRVSAELPGVAAEDLEVTVDGGVLHIKGHRRVPNARPASGADAEPLEGRQSFERSLRFPAAIAEGEVRASYKNGVLEVTLPKLAEAKPEVRTIPVETA